MFIFPEMSVSLPLNLFVSSGLNVSRLHSVFIAGLLHVAVRHETRWSETSQCLSKMESWHSRTTQTLDAVKRYTSFAPVMPVCHLKSHTGEALCCCVVWFSFKMQSQNNGGSSSRKTDGAFRSTMMMVNWYQYAHSTLHILHNIMRKLKIQERNESWFCWQYRYDFRM